MSGGHFNRNGYVYYRVDQFADELENEIENNQKADEYGYSPSFSPEVIEFLRDQVSVLRKMSDNMRAIDYLYSGDYGEESFMVNVKKLNDPSNT